MAKLELEEDQLLPSTHDNDIDDSPLKETTSDSASNTASDDEDGEETSFANDPRFNPEPPSPWKRVVLIAFVVLLFFYGIQLRTTLLGDRKPKVVYASRYVADKCTMSHSTQRHS